MFDSIEQAITQLVDELNNNRKDTGVFIKIRTRDGIAVVVDEEKNTESGIGLSKEITLVEMRPD